MSCLSEMRADINLVPELSSSFFGLRLEGTIDNKFVDTA